MFHPIFVALSGDQELIQSPALPIAVDEIYVSHSLISAPGDKFEVYAFADRKDESNFAASIVAFEKEGKPTHGARGVGLSIKGLACRVLP